MDIANSIFALAPIGLEKRALQITVSSHGNQTNAVSSENDRTAKPSEFTTLALCFREDTYISAFVAASYGIEQVMLSI